MQDRLGPAIKEAVELYDRQLESWLKAKLAGLTISTEAQAGAFREQVRRLAAEPSAASSAARDSALGADLQELEDVAGIPLDCRGDRAEVDRRER